MKTLLSIVFLMLLFASCQSNHELSTESPTDKAEAFLNKKTENQSTLIAAYGAEDPDYMPAYLAKATEILFFNRQSPIQGAQAMDEYMENLLLNQEIDIRLKVDLQVITFMSLDQFILNTPPEPSLQQLAGKSVQRLLLVTPVLEWKRLFEALEYAKPTIPSAQYAELKTFISKKVNEMLPEISEISENNDNSQRLLNDANWVLAAIDD